MMYIIKPNVKRIYMSSCDIACSDNCVAECGSLADCFCPLDF